MINKIDLPRAISTNYRLAYPFPHIILDNFIHEYMAESARQELNSFKHWSFDEDAYVVSGQVNKQFAPYSFNAESMQQFKKHAKVTNLIIDYLYSPAALRYLEELTGIADLRGDPDLMGGGVHRILRGGKLDIHADFNWQPNRQVWRRINLLLYLNKGWQSEWGGELELWDRDMSKCCVKVEPIFNRAVIFNITDDAYHGHPYPLNTPDGVTRDSIALYYYTTDRPEHEKAPYHPVLWQKI